MPTHLHAEPSMEQELLLLRKKKSSRTVKVLTLIDHR